ncbi:MAG TPA: methylenetetrahydrofolate reductase [Calditrichia bacterium]|nr:methylenetetrahydrofolate reductase [Calditrichia bacterium]
MQVIEAIAKSEKPILSLEITPPNKGTSIDELYRSMDELIAFNPSFINVTYHQAQVVYEERGEIIYRVPKRKKPGTVGICASISNRYSVHTIPHFICGGFSQYETEDALIDLHYLGIKNILALRGDAHNRESTFIPHRNGHSFASGLVKQIANMNKGMYLENRDEPVPTNFCIGVAGYPEKHFESPNREKDLEHLKFKVDQGAHYIMTQMFFDFKYYKSFVESAREAGITVPIIPGIKPIASTRQLTAIPRIFHINIPNRIVKDMESARTPEAVCKAATKHLVEMCEKLIDFGVPGLHLYTMGRGRATRELLKALGL